jgi:hypothetical protein
MHSIRPSDRRLSNDLTALKLALQVLQRKTELSGQQQDLVGTAIDVADDLAVALAPQSRNMPNQGRPGRSAQPRRRGLQGRIHTMLSLPAMLWRQTWSLSWRMLRGVARPMLAPATIGLRAYDGRRASSSPAVLRHSTAR